MAEEQQETPGHIKERAGDYGALAARFAIELPSEPGASAAAANDLAVAARRAGAPGLADGLERDERLRAFLGEVFSDAPFLRDLAHIAPERLERLLAEAPEHALERLLDAVDQPMSDEAALMRHLRLLKQEVALLVALCDLGGVWAVSQVTRALARFADACLGACLRLLLVEAHDKGRLTLADPADPGTGSGFVILAMGKHGAFELNYSSDIDIIVLFDRERIRIADRDEAGTLFVRMTRRLVRMMQERTAEGYVFRVDLRLRPDPGATPLALSVQGALIYYESLGQNWERAALIKARPCAGDIEAGEAFLAEIRPFIWRKSFDYAAVADVHAIKRQIHAVKGHGAIAIAGHDVKLGRGGIREIEFFVQTQQLIAGGREPRLRGRSTREMLAMLAELGWIERSARDELDRAYVFLRIVEHRIQMVRDEQTHQLPEDPDELARIARLCGFPAVEPFAKVLRGHFQAVQRHYSRLFEQAPQLAADHGSLVFTGAEPDPATIATLKEFGFRNPVEVAEAIRGWHFGRYPAIRSAKARERLTELTPALLEALARTDNVDAAFLAFDRFLSQLPTGIQLFSLLRSNLGLLDLLATIMGSAPRLAGIITRRPRVIDSLLDPAFFGTLPNEVDLSARLDRSLGEARSYEEELDRARIFGQEQAFLIGVRVLTGTIAPGQAGEAYAALADVVVRSLVKAAEYELAKHHGRVPGGSVSVVAMGKLGGREMTASSDLDLILLYDHPEDVSATDGLKPLAPSQYYIRLTQRLVSALSAPTGEGTLYEVDFRLRPSGKAGPLATHIRAFEVYQATDSWTWEQMALTRARPITGDLAFVGRVEQVIRTALTRTRPALAADVADMRRRIEADKGTRDPWDLKQVAGGMVDIEFIAQYLTLAPARERPDLASPNTLVALGRLAHAGILDQEAARVLCPAIGLYQALTQVLRLAVEGPFKPDTAPRGVVELVCRASGEPDIRVLEARLVEVQAEVRACFERIVGGGTASSGGAA